MPSRRSFLRTLGVGLVPFAGCGNRTETPTTSSRTNTATDTQTNTPGNTSTWTPIETPKSGVAMVIEFDRTVENEMGQDVTIRCDELISLSGTGNHRETFDIGVPEEEPSLTGVYAPQEEDGRTYRWFGQKVRIHLDKPENYDFWTGFKSTVKPITTEPPLQATVYARGRASLVFDENGWHSKHFPAHGE